MGSWNKYQSTIVRQTRDALDSIDFAYSLAPPILFEIRGHRLIAEWRSALA